MENSGNPLAIKNLIAGIIVTVIGGVILAAIVQDARFAPRPTSPTVTPTALPTKTAMPTVTPEPRIFNFSFCSQACDGTNATTIFPEKVTRLYAQWEYEHIPIGSRYIRSWKMEGKEWVRYDCIWPGPESGASMVPLLEPDGLHSGNWEISISINGTILLREQLYVEGNWDYWYPVGLLNSCFGRVPNQSHQP